MKALWSVSTGLFSRATTVRCRGSSRRLFFFSSRRRHTRFDCDWSSDVCSSDLGRVTQNPIATPALASGGTGDVLAGLIGGLMAQKLPPFEAAVTGVHLHGLAGMALEHSLGLAGVLASDLLPEIPRVMERLR